MSDARREVMGLIGSIVDRRADEWQVDEPIRCPDCEETFLWWATFCEHLPQCRKQGAA